MTYADPHSIFSFRSRFRCKMPRQSRRRVFAAGFVVGPLVFVFGSSGCFMQVSEGLAPFHGRGRLGVVCPTCRPRSPTSAKREPGVHGQEPRTREKTGRSIRRPARIRPLQKSPNRFRAPTSGRASALHAFKSISRPLPLKTHPFRFAHARRMRPLSVGRVQNAFHPARDHRAMILNVCEEIAVVWLSMVNRERPRRR